AGDARVELPTRREWWPNVVVNAATTSSERETSLEIELAAPASPVTAELVEKDGRFAPGSHSTLHFVVHDSASAPSAAIVSASVVDAAAVAAALELRNLPIAIARESLADLRRDGARRPRPVRLRRGGRSRRRRRGDGEPGRPGSWDVAP